MSKIVYTFPNTGTHSNFYHRFLTVFACVLLLGSSAIAQTFTQVTTTSGTTTYAGVAVTVTPGGGASTLTPCGTNLSPYFLANNGDSYHYAFGTPVSTIKIELLFAPSASSGIAHFRVNGIDYTMTAGNLTGGASPDCGDPALVTVSGGDITDGGSIGLPTGTIVISGAINDFEVISADNNSFVFGVFFFQNAAPVFTGGSTQSLVVCQNAAATSINTLLASSDADAGQTETWGVTTAPMHGTVVATYTATATGSAITPTGLTYTPTTGYSGTDAFVINVNDGAGGTATTTINVTVNALPAAISGASEFCEGSTSTFMDATSGGTWSSSAPSVASIGSSSGIATGTGSGMATITYTLPTSCFVTAEATVNPLPAAITGTPSVCQGSTTALASASPGGVWVTSDGSIAAVGTDGVVSGVSTGTATIIYKLLTACQVTAEVTVNPLPATISGSANVCEAATTTLSDFTPSGTWSSSDMAVATIGSGTGIVSGLTPGTAIMTYALPTGCIRTHTMTVNVLPLVYNVTGGSSYCEGGAGVHIGMDNSQAGYTYKLYLGASLATTHVSGGGLFDFGPLTAAGVYTATATTGAGCVRNMTGSATVVITPTVAATVTIGTTPGDTVCAGTATTFTATPVNGGTTPTWEWKVNGVTVSSTTDMHTYTPADGDVVTVSMTSSAVCPSPAIATANQAMVVVSNETPVATIGAFLGTVPLAVTDSVCQGSTIVYNASSAFGGTAPVYTWYKNGTTTGVTGATYSYVPVKGDTISVKLNSNYRCPIVNNVTSNKIGLKIDSVYLPILLLSTNTGLYINTGTTVTFTATVVNGGPTLTYIWYKNGTLAGSTNSTYTTNTLANNDSISCTVTSFGHCAWYSFNTVKMKVSSSVETLAGASLIDLVPNPNNGDFTVKGTLAAAANTEVSLDVTDMLGHVVYTNKIIAKDGNLNEKVNLNGSLANGMYIMNVRSGNERKAFHFVLRK